MGLDLELYKWKGNEAPSELCWVAEGCMCTKLESSIYWFGREGRYLANEILTIKGGPDSFIEDITDNIEEVFSRAIDKCDMETTKELYSVTKERCLIAINKGCRILATISY